MGLVPVLVTTFILSPFESGLVLPIKNLLEVNRLLRESRNAQATTKPAVGNRAVPAEENA